MNNLDLIIEKLEKECNKLNDDVAYKNQCNLKDDQLNEIDKIRIEINCKINNLKKINKGA